MSRVARGRGNGAGSARPAMARALAGVSYAAKDVEDMEVVRIIWDYNPRAGRTAQPVVCSDLEIYWCPVKLARSFGFIWLFQRKQRKTNQNRKKREQKEELRSGLTRAAVAIAVVKEAAGQEAAV